MGGSPGKVPGTRTATRRRANGGATKEAVRALHEALTPLPLGTLRWPPGTVHLALGDTLVEINDDSWIWIASLERASFQSVRDICEPAGVEWELIEMETDSHPLPLT